MNPTKSKKPARTEHKHMRTRGQTHMPEEIILQFLAYLTVKPLCRFKCVSKRWLSLISDPAFVILHASKAIENEEIMYQRRRLIFSDENYKSLYSFALDQFLNRNRANRPYVVDKGVVSKLDFRLHDNGGNDTFSLVSCCDGLALFELCVGNNSAELCVANPATRECKQLALPSYEEVPVEQVPLLHFGFGFDASLNDYKFVTMCSSEEVIEFSVCTLRNSLWRATGIPYRYKLQSPYNGILLSGGLHWFVRYTDDVFHEEEEEEEEEEEDDDERHPCVIICFNLETENVEEISVPFGQSFEAENYYVELYQGQLCIAHNDFGEQHNEFWVMKVYGEEESWTRITISLVPPYQNYTPTCYRDKHTGRDLWIGDGGFVMCNIDDDDGDGDDEDDEDVDNDGGGGSDGGDDGGDGGDNFCLQSIRKLPLPYVRGKVGIYIESLISL